MRGLCRFFFSRYFISASLILIELLLVSYLVFAAYEYSLIMFAIVVFLNAFAIVSLINRNANPEYKVSWLVVIMLLPPIGVAIYAILYSRRLSKKEIRLMMKIKDNLDAFSYTGESFAGENDLEFSKLSEESGQARGKASAILNDDKIANIYLQSSSRFFASGEEMFESIIRDISAARKYIFLEYFIIEDGVMWDKIHSLLKEKVRCGVEVRLMYDDVGCMKTLPSHYDRRLSKEGILCKRFSPVTPHVSTLRGNRDHRKIIVIDGRIAYTGGVNIADEYINEKTRFGHWKDGGIRIEGDAAEGFLRLFILSWDFTANSLTDLKRYLPSENDTRESDGGYYIPFGSGPAPIYERPVGKNVLLNIINQAESYVYITTPYLVIDYDLTESLRNAALRGVDVRIITPGIADKKIVKVMTKSAYPYLMNAGVRIYEYSPGFIHEKTVVSDDSYAVIGTINLDYRSFVHHYEDAVWIYGSPVVLNIRDEFLRTVSVSNQKDAREAKLSPLEWVVRNLVRIFAPLL